MNYVEPTQAWMSDRMHEAIAALRGLGPIGPDWPGYFNIRCAVHDELYIQFDVTRARPRRQVRRASTQSRRARRTQATRTHRERKATVDFEVYGDDPFYAARWWGGQ